MIGGLHVPFQQNTCNRKLLPAQIIRRDIRQQLRCFHIAAHFNRAFRRTAQTWQCVVEIRRVNGGIQCQIFLAQFTFDIRAIAPQFNVQARDLPLHVAVAVELPGDIHFVIFDVTGEFQVRHIHLPTPAVQTAAGFHQAIEFGRPVRELFRRVNAVEFQLATPANGFAPVEHCFQVGVALQSRHAQFVEIELLLIAFSIKRDGGWRDLLAFHIGAQ
ncbi:hypothetical protein D3C75_806140 [compost metagenome]